jgi:hypothetical protein
VDALRRRHVLLIWLARACPGLAGVAWQATIASASMAASRRGSTRASLVCGLLRGQQERGRRSRVTGAVDSRTAVGESRRNGGHWGGGFFE